MTTPNKHRDDMAEKYVVGTERADGYESTYGRGSVKEAWIEGYDAALKSPQVAALVEALEQYAVMRQYDEVESVLFDVGELAREALEKFRGGE